MPGLLDLLGGNFGTDDPRQSAYLALASGLLSGKGSFNQVAGNAVMSGQNALQEASRAKRQSELAQAQLDQMKREAEDAARKRQIEQTLQQLPGQFSIPASSPGVDATGGMDTALEAPRNQASPTGRMDMQGLADAFLRTPGGLQTGLSLKTAMLKQTPKIDSLGRGGGAYFDQTGNLVRIPGEQAPTTTSATELGKTIKELEALPEGSPLIPVYKEKIKLLTTRPPTAASQVVQLVTDRNKDLSGEDFLKTLSPEDAKIVRAIANGDQQLSNVSIRNGDRKRIGAAVQQYKPDFKQYVYPNQAAVIKDFTSGPTSKNITAINTTIGHMGTMLGAVDALKNGDVQMANKAMNSVLTAFGKPQVNNFEIAKQAVGNELMRVFRQVQASESETRDWESRFSSSQSPEQLKGAIAMGVDLLKSRIEAVNDQYKRGLNLEPEDPGFKDILSPKSISVMKRLEGAAPTPENANLPPIDKLKEGQVTTFSNGQKWTMQGGKPVQVK